MLSASAAGLRTRRDSRVESAVGTETHRARLMSDRLGRLPQVLVESAWRSLPIALQCGAVTGRRADEHTYYTAPVARERRNPRRRNAVLPSPGASPYNERGARVGTRTTRLLGSRRAGKGEAHEDWPRLRVVRARSGRLYAITAESGKVTWTASTCGPGAGQIPIVLPHK